MSRPVPKRGEVPAEFTWDLSDIFENDDAWFAEYGELAPYAEKLAAYRDRLGESAETLLAYFRLDDELSVRLGRLCGYAGCRADEDAANAFCQDMRGKATSMAVALSGAGAFAASELARLPGALLDRFYAECPPLETYRRVIDRLRRRAEHILSPECEKLLAAAGEVADGPDAVFSAFHNADLRFPDAVDGGGGTHTLTDATFVPLLQSGDRALRRSAFETYYATLGGYRNTLAATLDAQFRQLRFFADARRYPSTLAAALDATEVPPSVYDSLIESVHANLDAMYRYVGLRRRLLGVDELHMYDVYAPVVPHAAREIGFEQAKETVLDALGVLGDDYTALLREGFEHRWIDVYPNVGKRSGAYSSGSARPHPYVLLNQTEDLDSQFTLAHEMGHALHSCLSHRAQPVCTGDYVIFVAEVASTCNEVLLMRHLLGRTEDRRERAYLINHFLDQFKGTVYRQTMFAEFERELGRMAERGETLTADALSEKYLALNRLYFGPDMVSDPQIALEWARIPHFYYNYYVFQYATGFSAAVALADRILREGENAVAEYKRFLSGGCSADPISLLKLAGVDMSTPAPVNAALSAFGALVDELDALLR